MQYVSRSLFVIMHFQGDNTFEHEMKCFHVKNFTQNLERKRNNKHTVFEFRCI